MQHTHYLIVGASHAALSALHAIRLHDAEQEVTLLTRDDSLPYSPTVLPYVVSGRSDPEQKVRGARVVSNHSATITSPKLPALLWL